MELGAILLIVVVVVILIIFLSQHFTEYWRANARGGDEISTLLAEREQALNSLQEIDFEIGLGKVAPEEYPAQRTSLVQKGAEVLIRLEDIQGSQIPLIKKPVQLAAEEKIYQSLSDEDLEDLIAKHRTVRNQKAAGFCPKCGKPILQSDRFCPSCGQAVNSK